VTDTYTTSIRIDAQPNEVFPYLIDPALIVFAASGLALFRPQATGLGFHTSS